MTIQKGDIGLPPEFFGDIQSWSMEMANWMGRYLQGHVEWIRELQADVTGGILWDETGATLVPQTSGRNVDSTGHGRFGRLLAGGCEG